MAPNDLNTWSGTGEIMKPIDYATPWSFLELGIRYAGGITFLACHVPCPAFLHTLEDLSPGDRVLVVGELSYAKGGQHPAGGQHCVKVRSLLRLDRQGCILGGETPGPDLPLEEPRLSGDRKRRHRKRRGHPPRGQEDGCGHTLDSIFPRG